MKGPGTHCSCMCWIFTLFHEKSMIGQWVRMRFNNKSAHAKNSVYQALIWIRPGYEATLPPNSMAHNSKIKRNNSYTCHKH